MVTELVVCQGEVTRGIGGVTRGSYRGDAARGSDGTLWHFH